MNSIIKISASVRSVPLVNSWFAHPFLISPLSFSLYTKHSHLPLLDSFIASPDRHRSSVKIPELAGAPLIDYDDDVQDIVDFRDKTIDLCANQILYAEALSDLYQLVLANAKGSGLSHIYSKMSHLVRYNTEVSYDVLKQPSVRFNESMFYKTAAYDTSLQTCILEQATSKPRKFILSTPQFCNDTDSVELRLPFADPLWDDLYRGLASDIDIGNILGPFLTNAEKQIPALRRIFTDSKSYNSYQPVPPNIVRIRYFGHACVLVENSTTSILIDPLIGYNGESTLPHFTFDDLPPVIDYVLITHPHQDHVVMETLLRLRHKIRYIVVGRAGGGDLQDISLKLLLKQCGFQNVIELDEYDVIVFETGRIIGAPFYGEHADLDIRAKLIYGLEIGGSSCIFFADSNPSDPEFYAPLRAMMPPIDCLFLGMECVGAPASWLYGPFLQKMLTRGEDQSRRLDGCNAAGALVLQQYFNPTNLFVYAMGAEPWISHISSISYSDTLPQFQEARLLEQTVKNKGGHAEILFGQKELLL